MDENLDEQPGRHSIEGNPPERNDRRRTIRQAAINRFGIDD
jgi:hypothetical protein